LSRRHEAILPELSGANVPDDTLETSLVSDPRLFGIWRLVRFTPATPLPAARQALVDRLAPVLVATFDGQTLRAPAADFDRTMAVTERDGRLEAMDAAHGTRLSGSIAWEGDVLVIRIANGPWAGAARLERAR
jgi:hypothetical protein